MSADPSRRSPTTQPRRGAPARRGVAAPRRYLPGMFTADVRPGSLAEQVMAHPDCMLCIRHGQTAWNAEDRLTTRTDVPLDDRGRAQAALVAQSLRGARFARAYASPRRRAHDTAKLALTGVDQAPEIRCDERLVELDAGPFEGFRFPDLPRAAGRGVPCLPAGNRPTDPRRLREPAGLRRPGPCVPGRGRRTRGPLARREPQPLHPRARLRGARRRPGHVPPLQALERPRGAREVPPGAAASARRAQHPARLRRPAQAGLNIPLA
jgi:hypothetical protein